MAETYPHYSVYDGPWPWKNFTPEEVSCKHCGEMYLDIESMDRIQALRDLLNQPIVLNSAHRCPAHNKAIGGASRSQHLKIAFDCACRKPEQKLFIEAARYVGFRGVGVYPTFVHLDLGPERGWQV